MTDRTWYKVDASMPLNKEAIESAIVPFLDKWKTNTFDPHPYVAPGDMKYERAARGVIGRSQDEAFKAGVYAGIAMLTGIIFEPDSFPLEAIAQQGFAFPHADEEETPDQ